MKWVSGCSVLVQMWSSDGVIYRVSMLILSKTAGVFSKPARRKTYEFLRIFNFHPGKPFLHKLVLGIETSCDDTAAAVVDETGNILGEAIHSQTEVHLKTGGIVPSVAQQLHKENIQRIVQAALSSSKVCPRELSAVATTVKPGLALSLGVGLSFSLHLVDQLKKPFIPIHHMEAHALTIRLLNKVDFPFLVLLISGGHCLLALVRGVSDFLLLGKSLDIAPGDMLDKHVVDRIITQKEKEEGIQKGEILASAAHIAAAVQHTTACHIAKRTHRAILFCKQRRLLTPSNAVLVVSGGVASNLYIRKALEIVTNATECTLLCPPPRLCTDNGIMIAWNGIERLRAGVGVLHNTEGIRYEPKCPLGVDISEEVGEAAIKVPRLKMDI
ncbi:probable tRNA N6-adenosine threonylcarbamoyltransferase, mitochondrial isoform X2 [Neovison vison]|uniref:probable tRNA N6-adenosine threonylcarbamoyltransferase, mitochondrial isoform X2 n=1 Tax=Neovison vison TaxID=452646 RepID=UPI001CF078D0|nr:probable tRNA N6-adenosine threonylcarbamoyltransferase, mitochondrial isoform X2 [Neogale vison]